MIEKNKEYDFDIIDNGMNFEGISKKDDKVVFIPGSITGEKVRAKVIKDTKSYSIAKLEEIYKISKDRVEPFCPSFKRCGGCSAEHIDYQKQIEQKRKFVLSNLMKNGIKDVNVENTIGMGMPYYYRNKVQYPIRNIKGENVIGFFSNRSHDIVSNNCCYIQNRVIDILAKNVFQILNENNFVGYNELEKKGEIKHLLIRRGYHTSEIMVVIIVSNENLVNDKRFEKVVKEITNINKDIKSIFINVNESDTNEILGKNSFKLYGQDYITDCIGNYKYYISEKSFFQVNTIQAELLYYTLKENLDLKGNEVLFDLYAGVGSIGIFLSDKVSKIYGIEIEPQAVKMANLNINLNNVKNAEYVAGSVEDKIEEFSKRNIKPDVIVVDPPRRGLDEKSIEYIKRFNPEKIGYVSCNSATMARDLKLLLDKYEIINIVPVDLFPHTSHVECVSVLRQKN